MRRPTRDTARFALAWAVPAVTVLAASTAIAAGMASPAPVLVDRESYAAGWSWASEWQTTQPDDPRGRRPTDDLTRMWCRQFINGGLTRRPPPGTDRAAFLSGCDDATARTSLEATR